MNVLLTGSNGLIGSRTKEILTDKGYNVICIPHEEIQELTTSTINDIKPDYIIHLAAYGNRNDQQDEAEIFFANVGLTQYLLQITKSYPYKAFLNISSSSIYGKKVKTMKENMFPDTNSFYGCTKIAAEYLCRAHATCNKKPVVNIRPFTVIGKNDHWSKLIPTVIRCIKQKSEMTLDPSPVHDYVYVDDFIDAMILVMDNADSLKGESVNVGRGIDYSNLEIVNELESIMQKKLKYKQVSKLRNYDTGCWRANTDKMKKLGWKPKYDLRGALEQCL